LIYLYFCGSNLLMNRTSIHNRQTYFALLLLVVFTGSIFIKPVHILLVHHELTEITNTQPEITVVTIPTHHDCAICDFEFCTFISQLIADLPKVSEINAKELTPQVVDFVSNQTSHHFQLRAPPVI
jgi:hypothetical protein